MVSCTHRGFLSCFQGWIAYAYYVRDPYILASNIPGILVSIWLNVGASKLQYAEAREAVNRGDSPNVNHDFVLVPQEVMLLRILFLWIVILMSVGWLGVTQGHQVSTIGWRPREYQSSVLLWCTASDHQDCHCCGYFREYPSTNDENELAQHLVLDSVWIRCPS